MSIRMSALAFGVLLVCSASFARSVVVAPYGQFNEVHLNYALSTLPYSFDQLQPQLKAEHCQEHFFNIHFTLLSQMNNDIRAWRAEYRTNELSRQSPMKILMNKDNITEEFKETIIDHMGGYMNHVIMWSVITPNPDYYPRDAMGPFRQQLERNFGSYDAFKAEFNTSVLELVGSGFVWLVRGQDNTMSVFSMPNNMNPLTVGMFPILVYDAWQHAYIQAHGSDIQGREEALRQWWSLVEWDNVDALDRFWKQQKLDDEVKADEKSRQKPWKRQDSEPMVRKEPSKDATGIPRPVKGEPLDLTKYGRITVGVKPAKPPKKPVVKQTGGSADSKNKVDVEKAKNADAASKNERTNEIKDDIKDDANVLRDDNKVNDKKESKEITKD